MYPSDGANRALVGYGGGIKNKAALLALYLDQLRRLGLSISGMKPSSRFQIRDS